MPINGFWARKKTNRPTDKTRKYSDMKTISIGIDIGGTNSVFGLVDSEGKVYATEQMSTQAYSNFKDYVTEFSRLIEIKLSEFPDLKPIGIGIGAPNGNYKSGTIDHAPNLPWKGKLPIADSFNEIFKVPVYLTNDANAAAIGEKVYGKASAMTEFIVLTLGTGLGAGIYANGKMLYGSDGLAGEFGHLTGTRRDRKCACGREGCWETYVSATGIKRTIFELLAKLPVDSALRKYSFYSLKAKDVSKHAEKGDIVAKKAFEITGEMLGQAVADLYSMFSPEGVFLFGGLANAGDLLIKPAEKAAAANSMEIHRERILISPSGLDSQNAAVLGAAAMVFDSQ